MSYVTISLWNATEWSDEMEALAREKYVPLVMSIGASSVKMVQTGELSFAVITTYDSEENATIAQQRIAEIRAQATTEIPLKMESCRVECSQVLKIVGFPGDLVCRN